MARSDLLIALVRAALQSDRSRIESVTEAIIAEERAKQHNVLAERLATSLKNIPSPPVANSLPPRGMIRKDNGNGREFLVELVPQRSLDSLFLPQSCTDVCREVIEEHHRAAVLRSHGLEPRHRLLLAGPPGNGKTSLAEAIAYELSVPLFVVRYEAIIGSFLGETAARLKHVFDYARTTPCVLFFDEFDTLGKERGDTHETGEIKRVVSSLLLQIDNLPSYTIVIAATNHSELLDKAVWRRFEVRLELPKPSRQNLEAYFALFLNKVDESAGYSPATLAKYLCGMSYAEVEGFCLDIRRRHALSMGDVSLKSIISSRVQQWKARYTPEID